MKYAFSLLLVSALTLNGSASVGQSTGDADKAAAKSNSHIKTKYNRVKDVTIVSLKTLQLSGAMNREVTRESEYGQLDLDLQFTHPGETLTSPVAELTLTFKGTQKNQLWQQGQPLVAVIDDQTALMLGTTGYKSNSQTFYFEELMGISIPRDAAVKIANARTLVFQLGSRNVRIKEEQLQDIRALVARMTP